MEPKAPYGVSVCGDGIVTLFWARFITFTSHVGAFALAETLTRSTIVESLGLLPAGAQYAALLLSFATRVLNVARDGLSKRCLVLEPFRAEIAAVISHMRGHHASMFPALANRVRQESR